MEPIPGHPEWREGVPISYRELGRVAAEARQGALPDLTGTDGDVGEGILVTDPLLHGPVECMAVIQGSSAGPGLYDWSEVIATSPGSQAYTLLDSGLTSANGTGPLIEDNSNTNVPVGTVVRARLREDGESWGFAYPLALTTSLGSGSGSGGPSGPGPFFLDEANGIFYVLGRTGWWGWCNPCVIPGSGSGSGSGAPSITDTALGSASACNAGSVTIANVTVTAGSTLVVSVGTGNPGAASLPSGVTFAGTSLTSLGSYAPSGYTVTASIWYGKVAATTTGNIVVSASDAAICAAAVEVSGLTQNRNIGAEANQGSGTTPLLNWLLTTAGGTYYFQAMFMMDTPGGAFGWASPFTDGGQDQSVCSPFVFTEGFEVKTTVTGGPGGGSGSSDNSSLAGVTPAKWVGVMVGFA